MSSNWGRTYEADCFDAWLGQDRTDGFFIAMHNIEHAIRKPGLVKSFRNPINRRRILFTWLQNNRVAGYQSGRDHPQRNHRRGVEWGDACKHAAGLADLLDVKIGRGRVYEFTFHVVHDSSAELDVFETPGDFAGGIGKHFAMLSGDECCELVLA